MDSPIIISDGSPETHFHRKGGPKANGQTADVQIVPNGNTTTVTVADNDAGNLPYQVPEIEWKHATAQGLPGNPAPTSLTPAPPWTLTAVDSGGTTVMTMKCCLASDGSGSFGSSPGPIVTDFPGTILVRADHDPQYANDGSDLYVTGHQFASASYTENHSGGRTVTIACDANPGVGNHCKVCVRYTPQNGHYADNCPAN